MLYLQQQKLESAFRRAERRALLQIYNSRNQSLRLDAKQAVQTIHIYNSRNQSLRLDRELPISREIIYNSRNQSLRLDGCSADFDRQSTTVEIRVCVQTNSVSLLHCYLQQQKLESAFRRLIANLWQLDLQQQKLESAFRPAQWSLMERDLQQQKLESAFRPFYCVSLCAIYNSRNQSLRLDLMMVNCASVSTTVEIRVCVQTLATRRAP